MKRGKKKKEKKELFYKMCNRNVYRRRVKFYSFFDYIANSSIIQYLITFAKYSSVNIVNLLVKEKKEEDKRTNERTNKKK